MTKEQAELLKDVLQDAISKWHIDAIFPSTIEQMIDAKIEFYKPMTCVIHNYKEVYDIYREKVSALQELKTIMEGK